MHSSLHLNTTSICMLKMKNGQQNKREISQESKSHKIYIFFSLRMRNPFLNLYKN